MVVQPFVIEVSDDVIADLKQRLSMTRWTDEIPDAGWDYGTERDYLKQLVTYWHDMYNWRAQERLLNKFPQFKTTIDGQGLHFIHVKGKGPRPMPLLISHGWPGSFFEMYKIIRPLSDPQSFGGDEQDAFDVVVPSLPGYGFSDITRERGMTPVRIADLFLRLMRDELGYQRFGAQGGDWGSSITARLAYAYPQHLAGIHLNMVPSWTMPESTTLDEQNPAVQRWRAQQQHYQQDEGAYNRIQGTRPQTLAYGLNDSPVGLAAWIVEKFRAWSDCQGSVENAFTKDELLTNIMIYWVTSTINSSMRLYYETSHYKGNILGHVDVPTGVAVFPHEIVVPLQAVAEHAFNIQRWSVMSAGGHFAALEQPDGLVNEIRQFFRPLRQ